MDFQQQLPKWLTVQCLTNQSLSKVSRPHFYSSVPKNVVDTSLKFQFNFWNFYSSKLFLNLLKSSEITWNYFLSRFRSFLQTAEASKKTNQSFKPRFYWMCFLSLFYRMNLMCCWSFEFFIVDYLFLKFHVVPTVSVWSYLTLISQKKFVVYKKW